MLTFPQYENQEFLFVGIAKHFTMEPRHFSACYVDMYKLSDEGTLELVHR